MGTLLTIGIALIGSTGVATLVQFFVNRHDSNKCDKMNIEESLETIKNELRKQEKDNVRTQLLLLMTDYPDHQEEIIRCAEHYFSHLEGNWYYTTMFMKWLKDNDLPMPEWFKGE